LKIESKGTRTYDIKGAVPRRLGAVSDSQASELRQIGAYSYDN